MPFSITPLFECLPEAVCTHLRSFRSDMIASVLPLVALVGGLVLIQDWQNRTQISVAAEVDEALLGDDLPINAYRDPGFSEFLKAPPNE